MYCEKCGTYLGEGKDTLCSSCAESVIAERQRKRSKSFWGEVEKNQTTIEDFGYQVKTEIRKTDDTVIYIATNEADETVAIKKITFPTECTDDSEDIASRVNAEMEVLSRISADEGSRFVITYYDYKLVSAADKKYDLYIKMNYLTSLNSLYMEGKIRVKDLLAMGIDVCDALEWCHKNSRIHNNLNLNSIFINNEGRYVLGDFSLSCSKMNEAKYCIAPELYDGGSPSGHSDIFSLGVVMYCLLNKGKPPFCCDFSDESINAATARFRSKETPVLSNVNVRLADVIIKAISPIEKRFSSVAEFKKAMEYLYNSMPEDWLECNINDIDRAQPLIGKKDPKTDKKVEKTIEKKEEKPSLEQKDKKELPPEYTALKKKNIKDYWLIGVVVIVLIGGIVAGTLLVYNSGNRQIYSLIESGSYAVAYKEISSLSAEGENVDGIVLAYIDACKADREYNRINQILPMLTDDAYKDTAYFEDLLRSCCSDASDRQVEIMVDTLSEKDCLAEIIDKVLREYYSDTYY